MELNEGFADLGLSEPLLAAVAEAGYEAPTPIQQKAIPLVLRGVDLLGCAQTGTGKTASYALPIIDILSSGTGKSRMPRCLILAPTRELAQQIADNFATYGTNHSLRQALLIGGEGFSLQEAALSKDPDILIATPGRLIDMFERGRIMLGGVKVLVIDEGDRMLDMGFIPDVERIVQTLPRIRQTLMFSATLGPDIKKLGKEFLINPKEVSVAPPATVAGTVSHVMVLVDPEEKRAALRDLLRDEAVQSALIFCNRKRDVDIVCASLQRHGLDVRALHGDMVQHRRTETLAAFKEGKVSLLVCSDVAGRGLDIEAVSHVINFDVPHNPEDYVHRIGRTGRAGREGRAITLATHEEAESVSAIAALVNSEIPLTTPDGEPAELETDPRERPRPRRGRRRRDEPRAAEKRPVRKRARNADVAESRPKREQTRNADVESRPKREQTRATRTSPRAGPSGSRRATAMPKRQARAASGASPPSRARLPAATSRLPGSAITCRRSSAILCRRSRLARSAESRRTRISPDDSRPVSPYSAGHSGTFRSVTVWALARAVGDSRSPSEHPFIPLANLFAVARLLPLFMAR